MDNLVRILAGIIALFFGFFIVISTIRRIRKGRSPELAAISVAILVIVALSVGFYFFTAGSVSEPATDAQTASREARLYAAAANLVQQPGVGSSYVRQFGWQATAAGKPLTATATLSTNGELRSQPIFARPREQFHVSYMANGTGESLVVCLWEDEGHADGRSGDTAVGNVESKLIAVGQLAYFTCTAPDNKLVANLRVILRQFNGSATFTSVRVASDNLRVEPWPNNARAALAFSFDWESAMGGPIHSKGMMTHDPASGAAEGGRMRMGTEQLLALFASNHISATFYATGYDLLDGNTARTAYLGNPQYKWAGAKNGWGSDYWLTHGWYSDDPFSTVADPNGANWYFGDQLKRLQAAGLEIGSHSFGHLYVRGASPEELRADLDQWRASAAAQGITATTFAFPWRSSNSTKEDYYAVLREAGFKAVTRLYEPDMRYLFHFATAPNSGGMLVVPDFLLGRGSSEEQASEGGSGAAVGSVQQATQVISAAVALNGLTSFWNHPSALTDPGVFQVWQQTVAYARQQADAGNLWLAPVGQIVEYHNDARQVITIVRGKKQTADGFELLVEVGNYSTHDLRGLTLSVDGTVTAVEVRAERDGKQVMLPATTASNKLTFDLAARKSAQVRVTVRQ